MMSSYTIIEKTSLCKNTCINFIYSTFNGLLDFYFLNVMKSFYKFNRRSNRVNLRVTFASYNYISGAT